MKLAMVQMKMAEDMEINKNKTMEYIRKSADCDLVFFPEIQFGRFFPQYEKRNVDKYVMNVDDKVIKDIKNAAKENNMYISPNLYLQSNGNRYDASLWINPQGRIEDISKMVHIIQGDKFYERDYYSPSEDGFKVFDTPFGKIGIVICFDRHMPESIRTCTVKGAQLIIIPTANTKSENLEMFEWELRVQAMQNNVFIAMCNRVGLEDEMEFAGESIVVDPDGEVILKGNDKEGLIICDIDLRKSKSSRKKRPYINLRREDMYK